MDRQRATLARLDFALARANDKMPGVHLRVDTGRRKLRVSIAGELVETETPLQIAAVPSSLLVRAPNG